MLGYQLTNADVVVRSDGATIPKYEENADYRDYLDWLNAGNVATPADPGKSVP
ncbi:hypothetical protein PTE31013_04623 [Pandoraea terrigena]|uniref:Uncharacterized protein n=1 Tax=Pandoraea terrigena TaxID=2508292 RepID=A0A5E4YL81_9BURK|nr:hypothetical protein PTE31013_04623 [Pandoraea terrigena]